MRKLYLIGFLLAFTIVAINASAQSYIITPSKTVDIEFTGNEIEKYINVENTTAGDLELVWVLAENSFGASGWDYNLCDIYQCYFIIPDSSQNTIASGGNGFFKLAVLDTNQTFVYGSATLKIYIYELGNYENGDTIAFNVSRTVGIEDHEQAQFDIYPNPATDQLVIKAAELKTNSASIYNMQGRLVKTYDISAQNETWLDVSMLSTGSYVLVLEDKKGQLSRKVFQKD